MIRALRLVLAVGVLVVPVSPPLFGLLVGLSASGDEIELSNDSDVDVLGTPGSLTCGLAGRRAAQRAEPGDVPQRNVGGRCATAEPKRCRVSTSPM